MTIEQESNYRLYVQYEDKKNLQENALVKLHGKVVGNVIEFDQNPDSYIVSLSINKGIEIPLLSEFKIKVDSDNHNFVDIEPSDDKRILRSNEYFLGAE